MVLLAQLMVQRRAHRVVEPQRHAADHGAVRAAWLRTPRGCPGHPRTAARPRDRRTRTTPSSRLRGFRSFRLWIRQVPCRKSKSWAPSARGWDMAFPGSGWTWRAGNLSGRCEAPAPPVPSRPDAYPHRSNGRTGHRALPRADGVRNRRTGPGHGAARHRRHPAPRGRAGRPPQAAHRRRRILPYRLRQARHHALPRRSPGGRPPADGRGNHAAGARRQDRRHRGRRALHRPDGARRARRVRRLRAAAADPALRADRPRGPGTADPGRHHRGHRQHRRRRPGRRAGAELDGEDAVAVVRGS